jgi:hypothetical protein
MKKFAISLCLLFLAGIFSSNGYTNDSTVSSECDIVEFYKGIEPARGTKCLTRSDDIKEVELVLVPTSIDADKYVVTLTRKTSNLYKIDGTDLYVETRYCYEYATREEVVLVVEGSYGMTKGKIIF